MENKCSLCGDLITETDYLTDGLCPACRASFELTEFEDEKVYKNLP